MRYWKALQRLEEFISATIQQRRAGNQEGDDLLSMFLNLQDENGNPMNDQQLRDEIMTFFLAGHETTALALSWTWYLLSQHPEVEAKLLAELQTVLGDRTPTVEDFQRLSYTKMVLMESMRLYPPGYYLGRQAVQECKIGRYRIPAGATVFVSQWVMHRDPRYFDNPEEFNPDRWDNDLAKRLPKYAYFPFGRGPRICISKSLVPLEATKLKLTT